jgi:hypothetical protein
MNVGDIKVNGVYRTAVATWTVTDISPSGMLSVTREDGRPMRFGCTNFAGWVLADEMVTAIEQQRISGKK